MRTKRKQLEDYKEEVMDLRTKKQLEDLKATRKPVIKLIDIDKIRGKK